MTASSASPAASHTFLPGILLRPCLAAAAATAAKVVGLATDRSFRYRIHRHIYIYIVNYVHIHIYICSHQVQGVRHVVWQPSCAVPEQFPVQIHVVRWYSCEHATLRSVFPSPLRRTRPPAPARPPARALLTRKRMLADFPPRTAHAFHAHACGCVAAPTHTGTNHHHHDSLRIMRKFGPHSTAPAVPFTPSASTFNAGTSGGFSQHASSAFPAASHTFLPAFSFGTAPSTLAAPAAAATPAVAPATDRFMFGPSPSAFPAATPLAAPGDILPVRPELSCPAAPSVAPAAPAGGAVALGFAPPTLGLPAEAVTPDESFDALVRTLQFSFGGQQAAASGAAPVDGGVGAVASPGVAGKPALVSLA